MPHTLHDDLASHSECLVWSSVGNISQGPSAVTWHYWIKQNEYTQTVLLLVTDYTNVCITNAHTFPLGDSRATWRC